MADYQATPQPAADPGNTLGLVGLILAIIPCTSTIGLVLSIVGYIQSRRAGFQNSKALAGIIIGIIWIGLGIIAQVTGIIAGFFQG
ncbi:MAG TPA: hypothetical protein VHR39_00605 [Propionibacteriaceae bacterium]|jgi:hypothetical protein|nr:hypothetical protein [Propionibacteriaceae bacterium]